MILKYLKFLVKSSNQHGVHSPFVYNLVTKCFYKKTASNLWNSYLKTKQQLEKETNGFSTRSLSNKKIKLLIRLVSYFQPKHILEINNSKNSTLFALKTAAKDASLKTLNTNQELSEVLKNEHFDFIYYPKNQSKKDILFFFNACLSTITNDSIWVFNDIYQNIEMQKAWAEIKKHQKVTVTVDIFYFGLVFFRKEQAKEHFKIRV